MNKVAFITHGLYSRFFKFSDIYYQVQKSHVSSLRLIMIFQSNSYRFFYLQIADRDFSS